MSKQTIVIAVIIVYVLFRSLFIEPASLNITRYEIENDYLNGVRAAFLSDFHLKKNDYKRLDRIVQYTNREKPNIVFLGGDFVRSRNKAKNMKSDIIAQKLNLIDAPKYAVLGDDDWMFDYKNIKESFDNHGRDYNKIPILENSALRTFIKGKYGGRYIDIIGLKDVSTRDVNVTKAMKRTKLPRIVLSHNPDIYYDIMDDVTLILAGHTHGGQVIVPMTPAIFVTSRYGAQFASGLKTPRTNPIIISRGLGTDKAPVRFNCKPEIVIIDFVKKGTAKNKGKNGLF